MEKKNRLTLDAGGRGAAFCHTHPDTDPAAIAVATKLDATMGRAEILTGQQVASEQAVSAAVNTKEEIRLSMENGLAATYAISTVAAKTFPDLAIHRRRPRTHASEVTLLTSARVALAEAEANKDRLIPFGLTTAMLDTLRADIPAYGDAVLRQRNAHAAQVGAVSDLRQVCSEVVRLLKSLDAINRLRFKQDPEMLAAWKSARNVAWPTPDHLVPTPPANPPTTGEASAA
ncbi:MAG: hypothetical protein ABI587_06255 [Gemmatimonadales bacterium]